MVTGVDVTGLAARLIRGVGLSSVRSGRCPLMGVCVVFVDPAFGVAARFTGPGVRVRKAGCVEFHRRGVAAVGVPRQSVQVVELVR